MRYRGVPNRTPPPLLVPIRPPYPERSSATGFVAIAGGIVIGCQMRARPPLNLPKLRHVESERRLLRFEKPAVLRGVSGEAENNKECTEAARRTLTIIESPGTVCEYASVKIAAVLAARLSFAL